MVRESPGRNEVPKASHSHNLKRSKDDFSARDREAKKPETATYSKHHRLHNLIYSRGRWEDETKSKMSKSAWLKSHNKRQVLCLNKFLSLNTQRCWYCTVHIIALFS